MKTFFLACMAVTLLTACPDPEETVPPGEQYIDINQLQLTTLIEIKPDEAKSMIDQSTAKEVSCGNASAVVSPDELRKLLSTKGLTGMRILRANFTAAEAREELKNRPTILIALIFDKTARYYKALNVCPPPDGSTCIDGLYFPQQE